MVEAYPLYWPEGWKRTDYGRQEYSRFKTGFGAARVFLSNEIIRMGGRNPIISTNVPLRNDGMPRANMPEPSDRGVAVYFNYKKRDMVFACDKYVNVRDNIYAIGKTIEAMRGIERWGASDMMERAFRGFAALPERASDSWKEVLGVNSPDEADSAFKRLALLHHPDKGGDPEKFQQLLRAREAAKLSQPSV